MLIAFIAHIYLKLRSAKVSVQHDFNYSCRPWHNTCLIHTDLHAFDWKHQRDIQVKFNNFWRTFTYERLLPEKWIIARPLLWLEFYSCVEQALENLYGQHYKSGRDLWPLSWCIFLIFYAAGNLLTHKYVHWEKLWNQNKSFWEEKLFTPPASKWNHPVYSNNRQTIGLGWVQTTLI